MQAFIGQKYGDIPLPTLIPAQEFETIRLALKSHKGRETRSASLLDKWYIRDDNSLPPVYVLQDVKANLPEFALVCIHVLNKLSVTKALRKCEIKFLFGTSRYVH